VALIRTDVSESAPIQELTTSLCNQLALVHPEDTVSYCILRVVACTSAYNFAL
jgi:hypothetical protein